MDIILNTWGFKEIHENAKKKKKEPCGHYKTEKYNIWNKNTIPKKILDGINTSLNMTEEKIGTWRKVNENHETEGENMKKKKSTRASITYRKKSNLTYVLFRRRGENS